MKRLRIPRSKQLLIFSAFLLLAGCRSAPPIRIDQPRLAPDVTMHDVTFLSHALNREMTYRVYLPSRRSAGQTFPVVYLLHGAGDNFRSWSNNSDVIRYAQDGLILIMPEGHSSYYTNAALKPEDKYQDYLVNDLISDVETRLPAAKGRQNRAIVGVSMGGFAAVKLALSRPDLFAFAGAISPAVDVPSRQFSLRRIAQSWHFRTLFGPAGSPTRMASDPFLLVHSADPGATPYLYLTAGEQEPLFEPITRLAATLHARHFLYEFHPKPGGHDWTQWNNQIPGCFQSLLDHLPQFSVSGKT
jgi:putative tributyrin esterase